MQEGNAENLTNEQIIIPDVAGMVRSGDGKTLISESIDAKLQEDKIKTAYLKESTGIKGPAYAIDLRTVDAVVGSVFKTFAMFTNDKQLEGVEDRVNLYFLTKDGVRLIGEASGDTMYRLLIPFVENAFCGKAKLYYTKTGDRLRKVSKMSINDIRLDL